jgi:hypothetical protein
MREHMALNYSDQSLNEGHSFSGFAGLVIIKYSTEINPRLYKKN